MGQDLLKDLNTQQQAVVTHLNGPLLVLAGAGSGKTRCITYRVAQLIQTQTARPEEVLLLTFTNKAAGEMRQRVEKLVGKAPAFAGTFHSLCARILRQAGQAIGMAPSFVIYDEDDQVEAVKKALSDLGYGGEVKKARAVLSTISSAKNELIGVSQFSELARGEWQKMVANVYARYQNILRAAQALDFDDLLFQVVRLWQKHPDILARYQRQWQYVLVDEYQDTNQAQFTLTTLLAKERRVFTNGEGRIFAI
ncbi:MAG: UvrD-helicase domain-containing protein [Candidatus Chisholmbacteria bacterium]|nr:UvrD-helicase domain-containing protein [Candidatus Chisholmbacteria bacterium]